MTRSQNYQEEKPEEKKEELETYSKDVQRRIAKLTKKWREAERQKDEALAFAKTKKIKKKNFKRNILKLEQVLKIEKRELHLVLQAAAAKLAAAKEAGDLAAEVEAVKRLLDLDMKKQD